MFPGYRQAGRGLTRSLPGQQCLELPEVPRGGEGVRPVRLTCPPLSVLSSTGWPLKSPHRPLTWLLADSGSWVYGMRHHCHAPSSSPQSPVPRPCATPPRAGAVEKTGPGSVRFQIWRTSPLVSSASGPAGRCRCSHSTSPGAASISMDWLWHTTFMSSVRLTFWLSIMMCSSLLQAPLLHIL